MNKIYAWLASQLLSRLLPGSKTMIFGWITTIIGILQAILSTDLFTQLCDNTGWCLQGNPMLGTVFIIMGEVIKVLRFATGQGYRDPDFKG